MKEMIALLIAAGLTVAVSQEYVPGGHALFVRTSPSSVRDGKRDTVRDPSLRSRLKVGVKKMNK